MCGFCNKIFNTEKSLSRHVVQDHQENKKFQCNLCGKTFFQQLYLDKHYLNKHQGTKEINCQFCNQRFENSILLKEHILQFHIEESIQMYGEKIPAIAEANQELKINEGFAQAFNRYREKEEYQRLKNKYGEEVANAKLNRDDDDSSSSDEEEDEEGKDWTEDHEKDFFKTLASLKRKDSKLYDGQTSFFSEVENQYKGISKSSKDKPMTLIDLERQVITEKGGEFDELADENLKGQMKATNELLDFSSRLSRKSHRHHHLKDQRFFQ